VEHIFSSNRFFAGLGVVCFAAAAIMESFSADTIMPMITFFGAVAVGVYYAMKAPENARKKSQMDDADQHIRWLNRTLRKTQNRLSHAHEMLATHGIIVKDDDDDDRHDQDARQVEPPKPDRAKENNDKNTPG
jgi:hypothetical protein